MRHKTISAPRNQQQVSLKQSSGTAEEKKTRSAELLLRFRTIFALVRTQLSTNYPILLKCHFAKLKTKFAPTRRLKSLLQRRIVTEEGEKASSREPEIWYDTTCSIASGLVWNCESDTRGGRARTRNFHSACIRKTTVRVTFFCCFASGYNCFLLNALII